MHTMILLLPCPSLNQAILSYKKTLSRHVVYYIAIIKTKFTSIVVLGLLVTAAPAVAHVIFASNNISYTATAQPLTESQEGMDTAGNQTMASNDTSDLASYSNPNLGFSLKYPSNWQKEESLTFASPQGGIGNRAPEVISVITEVLPTSDFSLNTYSEAALSQVKSFQDFKLLNSSSTTLAGLPAHMIVYSYTEEGQTPWQNLQVWTIKDGIAYIITYGGTPEEFESSLPVLQSVMDSFRLE